MRSSGRGFATRKQLISAGQGNSGRHERPAGRSSLKKARAARYIYCRLRGASFTDRLISLACTPLREHVDTCLVDATSRRWRDDCRHATALAGAQRERRRRGCRAPCIGDDKGRRESIDRAAFLRHLYAFAPAEMARDGRSLSRRSSCHYSFSPLPQHHSHTAKCLSQHAIASGQARYSKQHRQFICDIKIGIYRQVSFFMRSQAMAAMPRHHYAAYISFTRQRHDYRCLRTTLPSMDDASRSCANAGSLMGHASTMYI